MSISTRVSSRVSISTSTIGIRVSRWPVKASSVEDTIVHGVEKGGPLTVAGWGLRGIEGLGLAQGGEYIHIVAREGPVTQVTLRGQIWGTGHHGGDAMPSLPRVRTEHIGIKSTVLGRKEPGILGKHVPVGLRDEVEGEVPKGGGKLVGKLRRSHLWLAHVPDLNKIVSTQHGKGGVGAALQASVAILHTLLDIGQVEGAALRGWLGGR
mmetsp:Transcript_8646/g.13281  ORF Transcript_8646/g.13281 Transcript_8646/m.13281 type:complete len:209 (+) Transcript_8646:1296-1922(+)